MGGPRLAPTGKAYRVLPRAPSPPNASTPKKYTAAPPRAGSQSTSHLARTELDLDTILALIATLPDSRVRRILRADATAPDDNCQTGSGHSARTACLDDKLTPRWASMPRQVVLEPPVLS
jgi:hypothetical protein